MSLIKRNGNGLSAFPALFDDLLGSELFNWGHNNFSSHNTTMPSVNIYENEDDFVVEMAAPGMKKDDFKVELDGNTLTISSNKQQEQEENKKGYTRREFSYQSFRRLFILPKDVMDDDKIVAQYEDGVLRLTIPKKEEAKKKAPRLIEIS